MKNLPITKVMIPWRDTDGMKQWSILTFHGKVCDRRIRREIRKFCQYNFNKQMTKEWIMKVPKVIRGVEPTEQEVADITEAFIQRIQDDEIETETNTRSQDDNSERAEESVCAMQNEAIAREES